MFNLSGSEIIFLLLAGLVVLGPDRLPGTIRRVGRTYADVRRTVREYEREFKETFKEPLSEMKSTVDDMKKTFGGVDTSPSPPMRPEKAVVPPSSADGGTTAVARETGEPDPTVATGPVPVTDTGPAEHE